MEPVTTFAAPPSPPPTPAPPEASLSTQERLRLAKRRRAAQMKRWSARDKAPQPPQQPDLVAMTVNNGGGRRGNRHRSNNRPANRGITFVPNVMLLEAAARNDVDEGEFRNEEVLNI